MADTPPSADESVAKEAVAAFRSGDYDTAIPLLRQAVEFDRESFQLRLFLGLALAKKEKWQDAESQLSQAYDLNSSSADAAYYLGMVIAKQGRLREAHGMFNVALGCDPNHEKAKAAESKTAKAAEQVTKDGSSAAVPGGLGGLDLGHLEMEALTGIKTGGGTGGMPGDVASALDQMKPGGKSSVKSPAKKSGCGTGLVALSLGLLSAVWGLAWMVSLLT